ncbi:MAG: DUF3011 domain-containing protein [Bdellovibrionales bacterium]
MKPIRIGILILSVAFATGLRAEDHMTGDDTEGPIFLFSGDEQPLDDVEAEEFNALSSLDADQLRRGGRRGVRNHHIHCGSRGRRVAYCHVPGAVVGVRVARQYSEAPCLPGRTFGAHRRSIWVRGGCRADFVVAVREPRGRWDRGDRDDRGGR